MASYRKIIEADDDTVAGQLLDWAGLRDYWRQHQDKLDKYDIIRDVLENCEGVDIDREEWDGGFPGRSGVLHTISTADARQLKRDLRKGIDDLLNPPLKPKPRELQPEAVSTMEDLIVLLTREAAVHRNRRYPAGYSGLGVTVANALEAACGEFRSGEWTDEAIVARLKKLTDRRFGGSVDHTISTLIKSFDPNMKQT